MSRIKAKQTLNLVVDGKVIEVKKPSRRNYELNMSLRKKKNFEDFVRDPKKYAALYDLEIDDGISNQLQAKLKGIKSIKDLRRLPDIDDVSATVWAVAKGAYSMASSKVAVAF